MRRDSVFIIGYRMQEIVRMQKVMNLSAFQQSPLAAIRQHVQNTFGSSSSS